MRFIGNGRFKGRRLKSTRRAGLALTGLLALGMAGAAGTALAATSAPSSPGMATMADMVSATSWHQKTGYTNGWLDGHTVRFFYSKNFYCAAARQQGQLPVRGRS